MFSQGVTATTLTEVRAATGTSNSQLYHYFTDKSELVQAVIAYQTERFLQAQGPVLEELDSWDGLLAWSQLMIAAQRDRDCAGGCSVGSLASELADNDEGSRLALVEAFERWQTHLVKGLAAMRERAVQVGPLVGNGGVGAQRAALLCTVRCAGSPDVTAATGPLG